MDERRGRRVVDGEGRTVEYRARGAGRLVAQVDRHVVPGDVDAVAARDHAGGLAQVVVDEDERAELDAEHLRRLVDDRPPDPFDRLRADERGGELGDGRELAVELGRARFRLEHPRAAADEARARRADQEDERRKEPDEHRRERQPELIGNRRLVAGDDDAVDRRHDRDRREDRRDGEVAGRGTSAVPPERRNDRDRDGAVRHGDRKERHRVEEERFRLD